MSATCMAILKIIITLKYILRKKFRKQNFFVKVVGFVIFEKVHNKPENIGIRKY